MVDLGGYIIILMNDNGKIKLYGSSADNADNPEVGDEILEVNGRTLENATDAEVSQHIHQCIKSGTISLQVTRRTGNKMKELDGPNADRIRDAWVIALERGARERLQRLPALRKIQPRDIQAILHQQITEGSASTSTGETPKKDVTNSHITVTLADREAANRNVPSKLSNGTVPKGLAKEEEDSKECKDLLEKQRSCPEEANLLQPVPGGRSGERRASSPFQNGRTEVLLIGETEGGTRSPRGSTSSATNDTNLLIPPGDSDYPESIYKSRRRSASGVTDIHLQQSQLQENNNGGTRDIVKGVGESRDSRVEISGVPDEMWAQGSSPGHHRELPVDVPDTLLEQAYANKQVMSLMLNRSETTSSSSSAYRQRSTDRIDETNFNVRSASDHEKTSDNRRHNNILDVNVKSNVVDRFDNVGFIDNCQDDNESPLDASQVDNLRVKTIVTSTKDDNRNHNPREQNQTLSRIIEINVLNENEERDLSSPLPKKLNDDIIKNEEEDTEVVKIKPLDKMNTFDITDDEEDPVSVDSPSFLMRNDITMPSTIILQKESSVDADEDYPFAKEDYPTMLKTCSDDSASPRSSSGRSDSTAPLDSSLILAGKESPLYDARRIDLGSPCRPLVPEIKIAPIFTRNRETTSFDNPAYGLAVDLHDLHQGLLMRSDEVTDLTRLIDEQQSLANGRKPRSNDNKTSSSSLWTSKDPLINQVHQIRSSAASVEITKSKKKPSSKRHNDIERLTSRSKRDELEIDGAGLLGAGSSDDLLNGDLTNLTITRSIKKKKQQAQQQHSSSGYSTLRSDASIADYPDQQIRSDRSFLVVGNRSYREVAVDCPPDFVPVTKTHPVYPPPNRTDNTIERNTKLQSLKIDRQEKNKFSTLNFGIDGKINSNVSIINGQSNDNVDDTKNVNDDDDNQLRPHIKADDFRKEVVNSLARCQDERPEKVRSRIKRRVLCSTACLDSLDQRNSSNTLINALSTKSSTKLSARNTKKTLINALTARKNSKNSLNAYHDASVIHACKITSAPNTSTKKCVSKCKNHSTQRERIDERLSIDGSTHDIVQRENNENSHNSQREEIKSRDTTSMMVYYNSKKDKTWFFQDDNSCGVVIDELNENDEFIEKKFLGNLDDTAQLENSKNSMISLEHHRTESPKDNDIKIFDRSVTCEESKELGFEFKILKDTSRDFDYDKFVVESRSWFSEPCLVSNVEKIQSHRFLMIHDHSNVNESEKFIETNETTVKKINRDATKHLTKIKDNRDQAGLNGVKPAIPPRDQKRAPARPPKDNVRLSTRNNNIEQTDNANTPEPTQQQLHSIRKYQEQLRRRKEEDERQESLNRSLRGSTQLKALESHATTLSGQENPAYAQDEVTSTVTRSTHGTSGQTTPKEVEEPPKVLTYGEVVATLERLQLQLRNLSGALGISGPGVEAELEAVRTLLVQRRFATALATHQALKTRLRTGKLLKHHDEDASNLARDCVEVLEEWQSTSIGSGETRAMVEELTGLLTSYEMEGLLLAHDSIISYVDGIQRKQSPSSSSPSRSPSPSSSLRGSRNTDNIKIIRIEKTNEPLGATVRNEGDAVIIGRVVRGGAADKSGLFHEGDEVLEVNGVEMRGKSVNEVCDILAGMQGGLTFLVLPASTNQRNNVTNTRREDSAQIQHVRAHFDYDPEEDPYIPCRELGVSFQKGDVLHVISQEDSNWWQAYREGEEDHTLAGLIPSRAFQHQRESMKQTIAGGKSTMRGSKKSSTLLCTKKNPKKKKKRSKFGSNFNDEGYPLYATTTIDDYDSEEVLTYEEVALYYPRADHKRPIVLIGPPNIGRHELRQRLMQDSERFAAAIPHTSRPRKGSEVDGQDYHFISRSQFESDILCRKFVEHGEYEKAYYGTSVEAIRSVVNSGKICVLNLHPQSLKILRSSDLKPYVVFVAPPSLEKLRQKRIKNNESFKEEELKDIIEKAREMEDKYGHLFDMIILNNDTDRAYNQLLTEINSLEREPQWVPASWVQ